MLLDLVNAGPFAFALLGLSLPRPLSMAVIELLAQNLALAFQVPTSAAAAKLSRLTPDHQPKKSFIAIPSGNGALEPRFLQSKSNRRLSRQC